MESKVNIFVTYAGNSTPDGRKLSWLTEDRCDDTVLAVLKSSARHNIVILSAGADPKIAGAREFQQMMSGYIVEQFQKTGYSQSRPSKGKSIFLEKGDREVVVMQTQKSVWKTCPQTEEMILEIEKLGNVGTVHVVITSENIPQFKLLWGLMYGGKVEFSGSPSREKRSLSYYMLEGTRILYAYLYSFDYNRRRIMESHP